MAADAQRPPPGGAVDPGYYVRHLDAISALERVRGYKRRTLELLGVAPGQCVLDVGRGIGDEVRALAQLVGSSGHAIGIDVSEAMVAEARRRAAAEGSAARFETGDASLLPFLDGYFDGCRADRVLQHLEDPSRLVAEMARVVKPGGRVVLAEPDWDTYIVDAPDRGLTRCILNARSDRFPNGWVGRQFPRLLRSAGLVVFTVQPQTAVHTHLAEADAVAILRFSAARAAADGVISAAEAEAWIAALEQADRDGHFFAAGTLFIAAARKA
ncbi:MAG: methyltransferase domain-containing protein [Chloroflexi bacterium]|nr:methyltransferase domain-containing protein [Chloroflexota bacterium]